MVDKFGSVGRKHKNMRRKNMINLNCQSSDTSLLPSDFQLEDYKKLQEIAKNAFFNFAFPMLKFPIKDSKFIYLQHKSIIK